MNNSLKGNLNLSYLFSNLFLNKSKPDALQKFFKKV